jgi:hypothetical protein
MNNRDVAPLLVHWLAFCIGAKHQLWSWYTVVVAVPEPCYSCNLVNQACLGQCEWLLLVVVFELDSKLFEEPFFLGEFESAALKRQQKALDSGFIL